MIDIYYVSTTRYTQVGIPVISCSVMKAVFTLANIPHLGPVQFTQHEGRQVVKQPIVGA